MVCHDNQDRMLDLAYGLLDAEAAEAIRAHAAGCAACSAALADAGRMQGLLGRAARLSFDGVQFDRPVAEVARKSATAVWLPWVLAASVMLAIGVLVANPFADTPRKPIDDGYAGISTENDKPQPAPGSNGRGLREAAKEWTAATDSTAATPFRVVVRGPETAVRDAANTYTVSAADAADKPIKIRVTVLLKEASYKQSFETDGKFTLPASLWPRLPAAGADLQIIAIHPATGDKVTLAIPLR